MSRTQEAVALVIADQTNDSLTKKCQRATSAVGLDAWGGVYSAYTNRKLTVKWRCKCCGQILRGEQNDQANVT